MIDSREFAEWMAYDRIDPFGLDRRDYGFAQLAAITANANRGKSTKPRTTEDYMPDFGKRFVKRPAADIEAQLMQWAEAHNRKLGGK